VQALTELVNKLDNELAKVKTQLENTSGTLADDSKHVEEAKKAVKEVSRLSPHRMWTY
jgi:archaellum component FlaC